MENLKEKLKNLQNNITPKKLLIGSLVFCAFISVVGVTWAWFSPIDMGNGSMVETETTTASLAIVYNGGNEFNVENILPGWTGTKIFTVTNTGDVVANYSIDWKNLLNTFGSQSDFVYSITSTNSGGTLSETTLPSTGDNINIIDNVGIAPGVTQTYTISFKYINRSSVQNDQGKKVSGKIVINEKEQKSKTSFLVSYIVDGEIVYSETVKKGEDVQSVPSTSLIDAKGDYTKGWNHDGKNIQYDITITPEYYYLLTFAIDGSSASGSITLDKTSYKLKNTDNKELYITANQITLDSKVIVTGTVTSDSYVAGGWKIGDKTYAGASYTVTADTTFSVITDTNCIVKGSKISMGDGTTKKVENIKKGDEVLSYDNYTGSLIPSKVISIWTGKDYSDILKVKLENGNKIEIVDSEYLFDTDTKKYILISRETYKDVIGKNVMVNNNGNIDYSKIVSIDYESKEVEHYSIYTNKTINYVANNIILNIPFDYLNDIYEIDNNYKVDMIRYYQDVKKYGLFTYEDFEDVCSKETFDSLGIKNLKIIVGKDYSTIDDIKEGLKNVQKEIDDNLKTR